MIKHNKNEEFTLYITDIGTNGEGIGHLDDGYTLFVQNAVVGDKVLARIIKAQKSFGIARLMKIIVPSADRITPICPAADKCGGCQISNLSYRKQLELKESKVRELLVRVGGFDQDSIAKIFKPIVGYYDDIANNRFEKAEKSGTDERGLNAGENKAGSDGGSLTPGHFRNKAQYPIGTDRDGNLVAGFYSNHSHRIVPCPSCEIGSTADGPIVACILKYMNKFNIPAYDETSHKGLVRHVLIRTAYASGEVMVCLVINGKNIPEEKVLIDMLKEVKLADGWHIESICTSSNTLDTNVIMGNDYSVIWGKDSITDMIGDVYFNISPLSFYQVNPRQTNKLYSLALEAAGLTGKETVWDLYCGIGTISLFLARSARRVYGVEIVPQAVVNAKNNAELNNINNAEFFEGKAEEVLPRYYTEAGMVDNEMLHPDVIVVDPPRKGCDSACLNTMLQMAPDRIVYVSCDPATLARDLKYLCEDGRYRLVSARPVDMFPNSGHVECVVLLSRV